MNFLNNALSLLTPKEQGAETCDKLNATTSHTSSELTLSADFDPASIIGEDIAVPRARPGQYFTKMLKHVFKVEECKYLIDTSEAKGYEVATVNVGGGRERLMRDYRRGDRCIIDSQHLADMLWTRIRDMVPRSRKGLVAVGLNERFRFLRYDSGDFFSKHRDGTFYRGPEFGPDREGERSLVTVQLYLNCVEDGGATTVYSDDEKESIRIVPEQGLAFLFDHEVLHDGELVRAGRKYAVRTEVMYRNADAA